MTMATEPESGARFASGGLTRPGVLSPGCNFRVPAAAARLMLMNGLPATQGGSAVIGMAAPGPENAIPTAPAAILPGVALAFPVVAMIRARNPGQPPAPTIWAAIPARI